MASAKDGAPHVAALFGEEHRGAGSGGAAGARRGLAGLRRAAGRRLARPVVRVDRLTPTIVEVVVRAPAAARQFQPGQFYRLQNFEALAPQVGIKGPRLVMEGLALTGAWVDKPAGLLSLIVLEMGGSSRL